MCTLMFTTNTKYIKIIIQRNLKFKTYFKQTISNPNRVINISINNNFYKKAFLKFQQTIW